jgi:hypothetical protein
MSEDSNLDSDLFRKCTEEIAEILEKYYPQIYIEDMGRINMLVKSELLEAEDQRDSRIGIPTRNAMYFNYFKEMIKEI